MKNPHIILLDGKLWAFKPPEKSEYLDKLGQPHEEDYDRAYSLALEQKIEVENPDIQMSSKGELCLFMGSVIGHSPGVKAYQHIRPNEPIKWDGEVEIKGVDPHPDCLKSKKCLNLIDDLNCTQRYKRGLSDRSRCNKSYKVVRLIAPVKDENSAMSYTEGSDYTLSRESDEPGIQLNTNISTSPVSSEQEKQEEADFLGPHNIKDEKWIIVATHFKTYKPDMAIKLLSQKFNLTRK